MTNEDLPQGLTDVEVSQLVRTIAERVNKQPSWTPKKVPPTAKQLLAHAMSALVEHEKGTLMLLKAMNMLAQQAVKEKKAAESAGEKWE